MIDVLKQWYWDNGYELLRVLKEPAFQEIMTNVVAYSR